MIHELSQELFGKLTVGRGIRERASLLIIIQNVEHIKIGGILSVYVGTWWRPSINLQVSLSSSQLWGSLTR
jgi:hypothetical protein